MRGTLRANAYTQGLGPSLALPKAQSAPPASVGGSAVKEIQPPTQQALHHERSSERHTHSALAEPIHKLTVNLPRLGYQKLRIHRFASVGGKIVFVAPPNQVEGVNTRLIATDVETQRLMK